MSPARSRAQQRLFAIAEHNPSALYAKNRSLAKLPQQTLHEFAATKQSKLPAHVSSPTPRHHSPMTSGMRASLASHPHAARLGKWLHPSKKTR